MVLGITNPLPALKADLKAELKAQQLEQAAMQREVMLAVHIAQLRDRVIWGSGLYVSYLTGLVSVVLSGRSVPKVAGVPLVMGGFVLAYIADAAYGTKMIRVRKEVRSLSVIDSM